ncbi:MAG TPA: hypothetical protein VHN77_12735, partial [Phycisphaerales bacterium]|nr:hypothetical protein [Phycisphaerales bacterium]
GLVTGVLGMGLLDTGLMLDLGVAVPADVEAAGAGAGMVVEDAAVAVVAVIEHTAESAVATGGD